MAAIFRWIKNYISRAMGILHDAPIPEKVKQDMLASVVQNKPDQLREQIQVYLTEQSIFIENEHNLDLTYDMEGHLMEEEVRHDADHDHIGAALTDAEQAIKELEDFVRQVVEAQKSKKYFSEI